MLQHSPKLTEVDGDLFITFWLHTAQSKSGFTANLERLYLHTFKAEIFTVAAKLNGKPLIERSSVH